MDDFYVFLKNDRNFFLKQLHFIISLISFLFLILTSTIDSVIVALAIPGTVLNSALLLGLYYLDERHDTTDIEILVSYGVLNLLAAMIFINKTLQLDVSIFRMLFLNSYAINILLCLFNGLLMLGEGIHRLIVLLVRNIYNTAQISQNLNVLFNRNEPNSSINISTIHKNVITSDKDNSKNTSPSISNFKNLPPSNVVTYTEKEPASNVVTYAEKETNTNVYEDILINRNTLPPLPIHPVIIPNEIENYTGCSHYKLNSEHDKHVNVGRHNSGDDGYISDDIFPENDRRSGDGIHCDKRSVNNEKTFVNNRTPENYFYPKPHASRPFMMRHSKNMNSQNSGFTETRLPIFVDRYGKRYIASLAGGIEGHLCSANTANAKYNTSGGDCRKKLSTPIDEFYTNRKYSNSKVTITPSKDEVNPNYGTITDSKVTNENNVTNNSTRIANNKLIVANTNNKTPDSNEFINNYNNYLAHLQNNKNNNNNGRKLFNYKFYNHNYDYQWVSEA